LVFNGRPDDLFTLEPSGDVCKDVKGGKAWEDEGRTFENDGPLRAPDIAKGPRTLCRFEIYPALPISENWDLGPGLIEKILEQPNWVPSEVIPVFSRVHWESLIEVRAIFESKTARAFVTAEIPKDFWQIGALAEHLWHEIRYWVVFIVGAHVLQWWDYYQEETGGEEIGLPSSVAPRAAEDQYQYATKQRC
jgi:hypothetical protein